MGMSLAEQAKVYDPFGCSLDKKQARRHWLTSNFIGKEGEVVRAEYIHRTQGILSVEFTDGSILSMDHWKI